MDNLHFVDKQYFERSDGNVKGIVATVAADDLVKLVADSADPEQINEDVFNDNVRIYKKGNRINERFSRLPYQMKTTSSGTSTTESRLSVRIVRTRRTHEVRV